MAIPSWLTAKNVANFMIAGAIAGHIQHIPNRFDHELSPEELEYIRIQTDAEKQKNLGLANPILTGAISGGMWPFISKAGWHMRLSNFLNDKKAKERDSTRQLALENLTKVGSVRMVKIGSALKGALAGLGSSLLITVPVGAVIGRALNNSGADTYLPALGVRGLKKPEIETANQQLDAGRKESWILRNPRLSGAISAGLAPAIATERLLNKIVENTKKNRV